MLQPIHFCSIVSISLKVLFWLSILVEFSQAATYYSFTGNFSAGTDSQNFFITLSDPLSSREPMSFRTWHHGEGGTNAAGYTIPGGGFDPVLTLYDNFNSTIAYDDDITRSVPVDYNSLIDRNSAEYAGEIALPVTLPTGDYRLTLSTPYSFNPAVPHWAVDIEGPNIGMYIGGTSAVGVSTLANLYMGSDDLSQPAGIILTPGESMNFTGNVYIGVRGTGGFSLDNATLQCQSLTLGAQSYVGSFATGHGDMNVVGQNASLTASYSLIIGDEQIPAAGWGSLLYIAQGGLVQNSAAGAVIGRLPGSAGLVDIENLSAPSGARSHWNSSAPIIVGQYGSGTMTITYGGLVTSPGGYIAALSGSTGSNVEIYDADAYGNQAQWDLTGDLYVGGTEINPNDTGSLSIGTGGWLNISSSNTLKIWNTGTVTQWGGLINTGSLINSGGIFNHNNGSLRIYGGTFNPGSADYAINGAAPTDFPNVQLLSGATLNLTGRLDVGRDHFGYLLVGNNSHATSRLASIGSYTGSQGYAEINGSNAIWTVNGTQPDGSVMWIGGDDFGSLVISNGGLLELTGNYAYAIVGNTSTGYGIVRVEGSGSRFESRNDMLVGNWGYGKLEIVNGGAVVANIIDPGYHPMAIGYNPNSLGEVTIDGIATDGSRSQWSLYGHVTAGCQGKGTVSITNGALLKSMGGYIAGYVGSAGSSVTLEGTGPGPAYLPAEWAASEGIYVGGTWSQPGDAGKLSVKQDAWVHIDPSAYDYTMKIWNSSTVELLGGLIQTGSFINSGGTFTHTDGTLEINGGTFDPGVANYILDGADASDMPVVKLLNGATANISGEITVGHVHHGSLEISDGSQFSCTNAHIGIDVTSRLGSTVFVSGDNSNFTANGDYLIVGWKGMGGMAIINGASAACQNAYVGLEPTSAGSGVSIAGAGITTTQSTWTVAGQLNIGDSAGGGDPESVEVFIGVDGLLNVSTEISVHPSGLLCIEDGTIQSDHIVLYGGKLAGGGNIDDPLYSQNGTIDVPVQGSSLALHDQVEIFGNSLLQKIGPGTLELRGSQYWSGNSSFVAADGFTQYSCMAASTMETASASLIISDGGLVQVDTAFDPFTDSLDSTKHVAVLNDGLFEIYNKGTPIAVASIEGTGQTAVHTNTQLVTDSIVQNTLTVGHNAIIIIRPLTGGTAIGKTQFSTHSVPEPPTFLLAALALLTYFFARQRLK